MSFRHLAEMDADCYDKPPFGKSRQQGAFAIKGIQRNLWVKSLLLLWVRFQCPGIFSCIGMPGLQPCRVAILMAREKTFRMPSK